MLLFGKENHPYSDQSVKHIQVKHAKVIDLRAGTYLKATKEGARWTHGVWGGGATPVKNIKAALLYLKYVSYTSSENFEQ